MGDKEWITKDEVELLAGRIIKSINEKDKNSILLNKITTVGEKIELKMDVVHTVMNQRIDFIENEIITVNKTIGGNGSPGLKTRLAVVASRVNLLSIGFGAIALSVLGAYMKLKN